jgi:hypothetical protein
MWAAGMLHTDQQLLTPATTIPPRNIPGRDRFRFGLLVLLCALLAGVCVGRLADSLRLIGQPGELEYGEAILYAHAGRLLRGEPLYQRFDGPLYTVTAYTPLYYGVAAGLRAAVGPGFGPGRVVSLVSALAASTLLGLVAARTARHPGAGVLAALIFLTLGFPGRAPWYALYKEDVLGVTLSIGAIALLLRGTAARQVVFAGALAALAFLTKQTLLAATAAAIFWLWWRDRRQAAIFVATWLAIVSATATALELSSHAFISNTLLAAAVPNSLEAIQSNLSLFVSVQAGSLVLACGYVLKRLRSRFSPRADLFVLYWGASVVPLVGLAKVGSNSNYWIEFAAATAVLASLELWAVRRDQVLRSSSIGAPRAMLLAGAMVLAASTPPIVRVIGIKPNQSPELESVVARVNSEPRDVLADPLDVVALANRDILLEPYDFAIWLNEGRWDAQPLIHRICGGEIGLLVLDNTIDAAGPIYQGYPHWPQPVLEALRETMVFESFQAGRVLYVPSPVPANGQPRRVCGVTQT